MSVNPLVMLCFMAAVLWGAVAGAMYIEEHETRHFKLPSMFGVCCFISAFFVVGALVASLV